MILSVIVIICVVRKKSRKRTLAFTGTTDVSMYASLAYGTHQVFSEPGMDHLYDRIDESYKEKSTTLQDAPKADDDETDVEGYFKMKSSFEVADQVVIESSVSETGFTFLGNKHTDENFQAADSRDHLPTGNDGYENVVQKRINTES